MAQITVYECDKCESRSEGVDFPREWVTADVTYDRDPNRQLVTKKLWCGSCWNWINTKAPRALED